RLALGASADAPLLRVSRVLDTAAVTRVWPPQRVRQGVGGSRGRLLPPRGRQGLLRTPPPRRRVATCPSRHRRRVYGLSQRNLALARPDKWGPESGHTLRPRRRQPSPFP